MKRHLIQAVLGAAVLATSPLAAQQTEPQQAAPTMAEGATVYAATCGRCHNPRAGTERTDAEWIPIVAHMRARANLTKRQAEAVLVFLQATNLPEPSVRVGGNEAHGSYPGIVVSEAVVRALAGLQAVRDATAAHPLKATAVVRREDRR